MGTVATELNSYGGYFNYNSPASQNLSVSLNANQPLFTFGTVDFTIEFYVKFNGGPYNNFMGTLIDFRGGSSSIIAPYIYTSSGPNTIIYNVNNTDRITSTVKLSMFVWLHVAIVRVSGITTMYINGKVAGPTYTDANLYLGNSPSIGGTPPSYGRLDGFMSNVRVVKGIGVYTGEFTPSFAA